MEWEEGHSDRHAQSRVDDKRRREGGERVKEEHNDRNCEGGRMHASGQKMHERGLAEEDHREDKGQGGARRAREDRPGHDRHKEDARHGRKEQAQRDEARRRDREMHAGSGYGLQTGHIPEHAAEGRQSHAELTRVALRERQERKREEEAAAAARAAAARRSYRPGKLSREEQEARRREMEGNAAAVDATRARALREDAAEADARDNAGSVRVCFPFVHCFCNRVLSLRPCCMTWRR
jgi:hypothetical protein